jgi:hypothetical protein
MSNRQRALRAVGTSARQTSMNHAAARIVGGRRAKGGLKVIFLDIDGVLNTDASVERDGGRSICPDCLANLAALVRSTGAKIVLTSTWRLYDDTRARLSVVFREAGLRMAWIDETPHFRYTPRFKEIVDWLRRHTVEQFAIIDDDPRAGTGLEDNFFLTSSAEGLTAEIAGRVRELFRRPYTYRIEP